MTDKQQNLANLADGEETIIYPHTGVALIQIAKVWSAVTILTILVVLGKNMVPGDLGNVFMYGLIALWGMAVMFAAHQFLHYSNTYLKITNDAVIFRKGWIPSYTDTIFWVNIKDINTATSVGESLLGTGTIVLVVAIRAAIGEVKIPYMPHHEDIASHIRNRIGALTAGTKQVTYT